MRVVIDASPIVSSWGHTGVARWTRGVIGGLRELSPGWDLHLLAVGRPPMESTDVDGFEVSFTSERLSARLQRLLLILGRVKKVESFVPDADVMLGSAFIPWPTDRAARIPVLHDLCFLKHPELVSIRNRYFLRALVNRSVRRAAAIVTVSEAVRTEIIDHYDLAPQRVAVVPNGCDPQRFHPGATKPTGLVPERYLLFIGTLEPRKNLGAAIEAHALLRRSRPATPPMVVVGREGWRRSSWAPLLGSATAAGDVIHLGPVDDSVLAGLYAGAEMLVFPSLYEGFGLPVLEAMACGCPVVASDLPVLREVAGDDAIFVSSDPSAIAAGIESLLDDEGTRERLGQAGVERAKSFTWLGAAQKLRDTIEKIS